MCYEEEYPIEDKNTRCCCDDCADIIAVNSVSQRMASGATTVWEGTAGTIYATVCPSNATCQALTWTSSNTSVLTCSGGRFTARSAGSAVVRAYAKNGVYGSIVITVRAVPRSITVSRNPVRLKLGCEYMLQSSVLPANAPQGVSYTNLNPSVAEADSNGRICGKSYGETQILVRSAVKLSVYTAVTVCVCPEHCGGDDNADTDVNIANADYTYSVIDDETTVSHAIGPKSAGVIDLRDGTLKFRVTDFAWEGYKMPVTLNHVYTSALRDDYFTEASNASVTDYSMMKLGHGWRLNLMLGLTKMTVTENKKQITVYDFTDENGVIYRLYPSGAGKYADRADAGITMESGAKNFFYVTAGSRKYQFDEGKVWCIYDTSAVEGQSIQPRIKFTYNVALTQIKKIWDGNDRIFALTYNTKNMLTSITAPDGTKMQYFYSGDKLTKIQFPRGESLVFEYDADSRVNFACLRSVSGVCMYMLQYGYDAFDNLTSAKRDDGLRYNYEYDAFHRPQTIRIAGKAAPLEEYAYKL